MGGSCCWNKDDEGDYNASFTAYAKPLTTTAQYFIG